MQVEKGVEDLDVNARYGSEGGEVISCGHKLAMEAPSTLPASLSHKMY